MKVFKFATKSVVKSVERVYETTSKFRYIISKVIKWKIFDFLGVFQILKPSTEKVDGYIAYNRFLNTDKPYVLIVENPMAMVHYSIDRSRLPIGKQRIKKILRQNKLKKIVCISKVCANTFKAFYPYIEGDKICQVYPAIQDCELEKDYNSILTCLYISSEFKLKGGDDILKAFENKELDGINLIIITRKATLTLAQLDCIKTRKNITLIEFNLTRNQLNDYYDKAHILLNPTRGDSFSLVTLEAIKRGCVYLGTSFYAIDEMVKNEFNGFVTKPKFSFWLDNGMPNRRVKDNPLKTYRSDYVDENVVRLIVDKLVLLNKNRSMLEKMSLNSWNIANNDDFSKSAIEKKWNKIFMEIN